eukprot:5648410-Pyramimonas_sp.AAC.1
MELNTRCDSVVRALLRMRRAGCHREADAVCSVRRGQWRGTTVRAAHVTESAPGARRTRRRPGPMESGAASAPTRLIAC